MTNPKKSPKAASKKASFHAAPRVGTKCDLDTRILLIDDINLKLTCPAQCLYPLLYHIYYYLSPYPFHGGMGIVHRPVILLLQMGLSSSMR